MRGSRARFYALALLSGICAFFVVSIALVFGRTSLTARAPIEYGWYQAPVVLCHRLLGFFPSLVFFASIGFWAGWGYFRERVAGFAGKIVGIGILTLALAGLLDLASPIGEKTDPFFSKGGSVGTRIGLGLESEVGPLGAMILLGAAALLALYFALGSPGRGQAVAAGEDGEEGLDAARPESAAAIPSPAGVTVNREEADALEEVADDARGAEAVAPQTMAPEAVVPEAVAPEEVPPVEENRPAPASPEKPSTEPSEKPTAEPPENPPAQPSEKPVAEPAAESAAERMPAGKESRADDHAPPRSAGPKSAPSPPGVIHVDYEALLREEAGGMATGGREEPTSPEKASHPDPRREDWSQREIQRPAEAPLGGTSTGAARHPREPSPPEAPKPEPRAASEASQETRGKTRGEVHAGGGERRDRRGGFPRDYWQAVQIVRETGRASEILLQRRLGVGYVDATRLLDRMEEEGVVTPPRQSGFREVIPPPGEES